MAQAAQAEQAAEEAEEARPIHSSAESITDKLSVKAAVELCK